MSIFQVQLSFNGNELLLGQLKTNGLSSFHSHRPVQLQSLYNSLFVKVSLLNQLKVNLTKLKHHS